MHSRWASKHNLKESKGGGDFDTVPRLSKSFGPGKRVPKKLFYVAYAPARRTQGYLQDVNNNVLRFRTHPRFFSLRWAESSLTDQASPVQGNGASKLFGEVWAQTWCQANSHFKAFRVPLERPGFVEPFVLMGASVLHVCQAGAEMSARIREHSWDHAATASVNNAPFFVFCLFCPLLHVLPVGSKNSGGGSYVLWSSLLHGRYEMYTTPIQFAESESHPFKLRNLKH